MTGWSVECVSQLCVCVCAMEPSPLLVAQPTSMQGTQKPTVEGGEWWQVQSGPENQRKEPV